MATKGWETATLQDVRDRRVPAKKSKYRNVKVVIDGIQFDSKREAAYWQGLKAREFNGEIANLQRQVPFGLMTPNRADPKVGGWIVVAHYVADFVFDDLNGQRHVVDAKGHRTAIYKLKKRWLELQEGIVIEEV